MVRILPAFAFMMISSLISGTVHAKAPYTGKWAAADLSCKDEAIVLEDRALHGAENACRFAKVDAKDRRYTVEATCRGEGLTEEAWSFVIDMIDANAMVMTYANGQPILYRRCPD